MSIDDCLNKSQFSFISIYYFNFEHIIKEYIILYQFCNFTLPIHFFIQYCYFYIRDVGDSEN